MAIRRYLVVCVCLGILLAGPIGRSWPVAVRLLYVVGLPAATWLTLRFVWARWDPSTSDEARLARVVAGATAGVLLAGSAAELRADRHLQCTASVQTRDGSECVGDYVVVPGPDRGKAAFLVIAAGFAVWFGMRAVTPADDSGQTRRSLDS